MKNFWQKLKKPIYALAPMAGVADSAFRQMCKQCGADIVYSEMASAAGLVYNPKKTLTLLKFSKIERPYVVQLFGSKPEQFARAVKLIEKEIKPDGIDLNFGCPAKKVIRQGAGAVLMDDPRLARKIIVAVIKNSGLPVSIKIRAKARRNDALRFFNEIKDLDIKAVMIHGRTLAQGNSGEVDWKIIRQIRPQVRGVLLANGGVRDRVGASELLEKTGADGLGIGQGALGRPWIFEDLKSQSASFQTNVKIKEEILKIILKHAKLAEKQKGRRGIVEMRKHLCWYASGRLNAGKLRFGLTKVENFSNIKMILKDFG